MDLFLAFSEGGTEFYLNQSAHPFPTVFWKKAERDDSQLGTCFLVPMHSHQIVLQKRGIYEGSKPGCPGLRMWFALYTLSNLVLN